MYKIRNHIVYKLYSMSYIYKMSAVNCEYVKKFNQFSLKIVKFT